MGACATPEFCCADYDRKNSNHLKAYISNLHLTGIDGLGDLGSSEFDSKFKNEYEEKMQLKLNKHGLLEWFDWVMKNFKKTQIEEQPENALAKVNVKVIEKGIGLCYGLPCVL